ncbi:50S ribosomal protein L13 [Candidatus Shapirobacteria bacterium]|nr:50S ribosomal protein L13 [Candidatus Shapirobacteria bacterium]
MNFKTQTTKKNQIKRDWHLLDAKEQILGRLASEIAFLLMGKDKPYWVDYLDCGDYVVVINAGKIRVSGRKDQNKVYYRHSGYPGGFKKISFAQQMSKDPTQIIRHAVEGMLPKNKLQDERLARLKIFVDEKHDYQDKFSAKKK